MGKMCHLWQEHGFIDYVTDLLFIFTLKAESHYEDALKRNETSSCHY